MTTNDVFGRNLSTWLHEDAEHHVPDHLAEVLQRTAATRQRPAWSSLERWLPMDTTLRPRTLPLPSAGRLLLVAALLILAALAVIAIGRMAIPATRSVRVGAQRLDRHQPRRRHPPDRSGHDRTPG